MTARATVLAILLAAAPTPPPCRSAWNPVTRQVELRCDDGVACDSKGVPGGIETKCSDGSWSVTTYDAASGTWRISVRDQLGIERGRCTARANGKVDCVEVGK